MTEETEAEATSTTTKTSMEVENVYATSSTAVNNDADAVGGALKRAAPSQVFSPELLQMYYARLFPFDLLHQWLSYGDSSTFGRREFSMTIEPQPGEEVYLRYQSFENASQLSAAVLKRRPTKIDLGAIFSHPPKLHHTLPTGHFLPLQREFVVDIDLTDYDDIRHCGCSGARICPTCWTFMPMAVECLDDVLRRDFGFAHVAWFYSGRRGMHAWVGDETARNLTDAGRGAVAQYLEVNNGNDKNKDTHLSYPLHPTLQRALQLLEPHFIKHVLPDTGHGLLTTPDRWTEVLDRLPSSAVVVREHLDKSWNSSKNRSTPAEKWDELKKHVKAFCNESKKAGLAKASKTLSGKERSQLELWYTETVFYYTYPRIDINVSKMRNHLLKSPFCVHPKTGRVCVPVDATKMAAFDPFRVPTLAQLQQELDNYEQKEYKTNIPDWQKTSLKEYFCPFVEQFLAPLTKLNRLAQRDAAEDQAAVTGDF